MIVLYHSPTHRHRHVKHISLVVENKCAREKAKQKKESASASASGAVGYFTTHRSLYVFHSLAPPFHLLSPSLPSLSLKRRKQFPTSRTECKQQNVLTSRPLPSFPPQERPPSFRHYWHRTHPRPSVPTCVPQSSSSPCSNSTSSP